MLSSPQIVSAGASLHVKFGSDNGLYPVFSMNAVKDDEQSIKEGRDIYKDVEWIEIHIVGDNLTKISRPVTDEDRQRFANYYATFKNQNIQAHEGTPITEWPPISKAMALTLKSMNIHTVEQLAAVADVNLKWMGARELQKKAIAWLDQAKGGAGIGAMQEENKSLRVEIEAMKNQMAALMNNQADQTKRKGRPPKEVDNE
jgi:hypothetical protein